MTETVIGSCNISHHNYLKLTKDNYLSWLNFFSIQKSALVCGSSSALFVYNMSYKCIALYMPLVTTVLIKFDNAGSDSAWQKGHYI